MVAYGEFRTSYNQDPQDHRIVFYGIRYYIENYIAKPWTAADLAMADQFFQTHNVENTPYPFPKHLFTKMIAENDGYFPVTIQSLPEGSVIYPHVPVYQITASDEYAPLVTYLETLLTMVWVRNLFAI
jgi:nicotinamide phosphoribosyltransferase